MFWRDHRGELEAERGHPVHALVGVGEQAALVTLQRRVSHHDGGQRGAVARLHGLHIGRILAEERAALLERVAHAVVVVGRKLVRVRRQRVQLLH